VKLLLHWDLPPGLPYKNPPFPGVAPTNSLNGAAPSGWINRAEPAGDVGDDGRIHVLHRLVFGRRGRAAAGEEEMAVGVVRADGNAGSIGEAGFP
jgi:hypothetical protein